MKNWKEENWLALVKMEKFTRTRALKDLANGTVHDRPLNARRKNKWTEIFDSGKYWPGCPTQAPIIYSPDNKRLNGQTRLAGFANSTLSSVMFPVLRGVPEEAYRLLDMDGWGRSPKDANFDLINVNRDAARVNWLHALLIGDRFYFSPAILLREKIENTYHEEVDWVGKIMPNTARHERAPYAVPFMYIYRYDQEFASRMAKVWVLGSPLSRVLVKLRDQAQQPTRQWGEHSVVMRGGGRLYTHEEPTFSLFNALAEVHQERQIKTASISDKGFQYWSHLLKDGAWKRYRDQVAAPKKSVREKVEKGA